MGKSILYAFLILAGVLIGILCGVAYGRYEERHGGGAARDTVIQWQFDTIEIEKPVPYYITKVVKDSIMVPIIVTDTLIQGKTDTLYVPVVREQAFYKDSTYEAWVSGFQPQLDSIHLFRDTKIVTVTRKSRWSLGVQAGAGLAKSGFSPYIGVGLSYNILSF